MVLWERDYSRGFHRERLLGTAVPVKWARTAGAGPWCLTDCSGGSAKRPKEGGGQILSGRCSCSSGLGVGCGGGAPWPAGTCVHGLGDHSCHARNILASKLGNQIFSFVFKRERRKPPHLYTEAVPRAGGRREVPGI